MKIGILTFHSQLNYGGGLQCWALQTALEELGHEVVVIDRWLDKENSFLEKGYDKFGILQWVKFCVRSLMGLGNFNQFVRVRRTKRFLCEYLNLTPYHFNEWSDAPLDLGVDLLVVGSDQVWHCGDWGDPSVYLLEDAPKVPAIAYAASFGMSELPPHVSDARKEETAVALYQTGLAKFRAISCRENEGVALCHRLGFEALHVVDPTLLLNNKHWETLIGKRKLDMRKRLVCYFLDLDYKETLGMLKTFSGMLGCKVDVFVNEWIFDVLPMPTDVLQAKAWASGLKRKWFGDVSVLDAAGPMEFANAIANAEFVISDSFHALMISLVFGRNVRILAPQSEPRRKMFSRIEEFVAHINGPLVVDNIENALDSFVRGETVKIEHKWLASKREESLGFLSKYI